MKFANLVRSLPVGVSSEPGPTGWHSVEVLRDYDEPEVLYLVPPEQAQTVLGDPGAVTRRHGGRDFITLTPEN